ncbi:hypothetical protein BGW38_002410 [Lunasporangiospora selenospora]|uniref:Uncharacterized protein n=1 Tax=Lunasporangiospora selenospora TaxID=979761 RepID=A0A9P6KDJ3_9FUNG|nr:hypothetical protein BGW38_002410 [Lunasporangiospora selenospora]
MSRRYKSSATIPPINEQEQRLMAEAARKNEEMLLLQRISMLSLNVTESNVMLTVAETGSNAARLKQMPQVHVKLTESLVNSSGAHFRPYTQLPTDRVLLLEYLQENPAGNEHPVGDGAT